MSGSPKTGSSASCIKTWNALIHEMIAIFVCVAWFTWCLLAEQSCLCVHVHVTRAETICAKHHGPSDCSRTLGHTVQSGATRRNESPHSWKQTCHIRAQGKLDGTSQLHATWHGWMCKCALAHSPSQTHTHTHVHRGQIVYEFAHGPW